MQIGFTSTRIMVYISIDYMYMYSNLDCSDMENCVHVNSNFGFIYLHASNHKRRILKKIFGIYKIRDTRSS